jgi:phenylpropionate dioxygenase-like ring-hydroxylating dioxygenase large terminal subunit
MFLRNCWYVAGWDSEVGREPMARTVTGIPVILYRTENGDAVALEDRCCHRNLPLSQGRVEGDAIRCGYHGLKFDRTGACIEIPSQRTIPTGARVRSFPLVEKFRLLWIWMGDAAQIDESLIPNWHPLADPKMAVAVGNNGKPLYMRCNWELNNDNLLDLTHVVYVHSGTLGGDGLDRFPIKTERHARGVNMTRWIPDTKPIPLFAQYLNYTGTVDRWQGTEAFVASHCTIDAGFTPAGLIGPDGDRDSGIRLRALITATPETATTSFMFYAQCRNFALDDKELSDRVVTDFRRVFLEDVAVMEGQERNAAALPGAPTIDINIDAPPLAMRRLVRQFIAEETAWPAA